MTRLVLRDAIARDVPLILALVKELAVYEREPEAVVATEGDLLRDGFGASPKFDVLIAEWDGEPAGFALTFGRYSTWRGRRGLYLEDLFVRERHRRNGIGLAMLAELARRAVAQGCARFEWTVLDWNTPAVDFYASLGAKVLREWWLVRLDGDALDALAKRANPR